MKKSLFTKIGAIVLGLGLLVTGGVSLAHTNVSEARAAAGTDTLNGTTLGLAKSYGDFTSSAFATTGTVYAGNAQIKDKTTSTIQIRSKNNNSGIVVTASNGKATNISITWNTDTSSGNVLNVYSKADAYTAATELYNTSTQGTLLTSFKYASGTTTASFDISGTHQYIGFRSNSGALYLDSIQITWAEISETEPAVEIDQSSLELVAGNTGTLTATTKNAGENSVVWSSSDSSVVTIDSASGAYEALKMGSADITATLTVNGVDYTSKITILVNGSLSVDEAYSVASALDSGATTAYKVTVNGKISSVSTGKPYSAYFTTTESKQLQAYFAYTEPTSFDQWIVNGTLNITGNLQHFYNSKTSTSSYEIVNPTVNSYTDDAIDFVVLANSSLDAECAALAVTADTWDTLAELYAELDSYAQAKLVAATSADSNTEIAKFISRYDYIVAKYAYNNFMSRASSSNVIRMVNNNNNAILIVIIASALACTLISAIYFMLRKKKAQ